MLQKTYKTAFILLLIIVSVASHGQITRKTASKPSQRYASQDPVAHHKIALEILAASKQWIHKFNQGNAKFCGQAYQEKAVMRPTPFKVQKGAGNITKFWQKLIKDGANNLVYTQVAIEVINENVALLSANWRMNIGRGVIYKEKWEKNNGKWLLSHDDFEILEQFKTPRKNTTPATASHEALEAFIRTSIAWTIAYNKQDYNACGEGYAEDADLSPKPFPWVHGKENIAAFWAGLIKNGAGNLIYNNPTFRSITNRCITLSSNWSMNIGEGKIYQEKWVLTNGKWVLQYDDFEVLKKY